MKLTTARSAHLDALAARGCATHTIELYGFQEQAYLNWWAFRGIATPTHAEHLTAETVRDFTLYLRNDYAVTRNGLPIRRLAPASIRNCLSILKAWASFLTEEGLYPDGNPLARVRVPKIPKTIPDALTEEEQQRLVKLCAATELPLRNRALLLFLADTGLRVSEAVNVNVADLQLATWQQPGLVKVLGKGNKERIAGFGRETSKAIHQYLTSAKQGRPATYAPHLFVTRSGAPMSTDAVRFVIHTLGASAGIDPKKTHPHAWRHSFSRAYLRQNPGQITQLQQLLGHARLEQTQHYAALLGGEAAQGYRSVVDSWKVRTVAPMRALPPGLEAGA